MSELLDEMIAHQENKLLKLAREMVPSITKEDLLQPFDYAELESSPHFRYEEGILHGILSVKAALQAGV
ncbi:MAG: hypothetical protein SP4CHLAM5_00760 [Chlamydiia bacterium]|nr:hypothetical protein [Chlamydiia bacterium]MCH9617953.1 hypothetical protein [Chlamydiia bacterium]MCH9623722.1 hypothetical protein [Chlamydiia bacterium]